MVISFALTVVVIMVTFTPCEANSLAMPMRGSVPWSHIWKEENVKQLISFNFHGYLADMHTENTKMKKVKK